MAVDRTDPNRHLPPHPRNQHCVEGICQFIDSLFDDNDTKEPTT